VFANPKIREVAVAIAGAVVVPVSSELTERVIERLTAMSMVEVQALGSKGIAVTLQDDDADFLKKVSKEISGWEEVLDFQLAYLNWEELEE
jgi:nitrate reductase NapAB chaperone NapD